MDKGNPPVDRHGEAAMLVERGLALYGKGDVHGAVRHWQAARLADPENRRALEYLAFVRANEGIEPEQVPVEPGAIQLEPEPIGPAREVVIPEYIPNPPAGAPPILEVTVSTPPPRPPFTSLEPVPAPPASPAPAADSESELLREMRDRMGHDDFSGALEVVEKLLALEPEHLEALEAREHATQSLMRILESKIGNLKAVPVVKIPADEVIWLNLNHREGFVLSQVDGALRYDDILDVCGMPRLEALRVLANLVIDGVIGPAPDSQ